MATPRCPVQFVPAAVQYTSYSHSYAEHLGMLRVVTNEAQHAVTLSTLDGGTRIFTGEK